MIQKIFKSLSWLIFALSISANTTDFLIRIDYPFFSQFFCLTFVVLFFSMWLFSGNPAISTKPTIYSILSLFLEFLFSILFLYFTLFFNFSFIVAIVVSCGITAIPLLGLLWILPKIKFFKINAPLIETNDISFKNRLLKANFKMDIIENGVYKIQDGKRTFLIYLTKDNSQLVIDKGKFKWESKWNNEYTSAHSWVLSHYSTYKRPYVIVVNPYGEHLQPAPLHLQEYDVLMLTAASQDRAAEVVEDWIDYISASNQ